MAVHGLTTIYSPISGVRLRDAALALVAASLTAGGPSPAPVRLSDLPPRYFVAHRGAGAYVAPENTEQALRRGYADPDADLLEFDVRTLADGAGEIWHDPTVDRLTTSTGPVGRLSSAEFAKLVVDASSWFGGGVANTHPILLDQVLSEFGGKRLLLAHPKDTAAMKRVIDEVTRRGLRDSVLIQTSSREDLRRVLKANLNGQLLVRDATKAEPADLVAEGITRVSVYDGLPDGVIRGYVRAGLTVTVWNVDRQYRRDRLYRLGVRGIDSNDPTYVSGDVARYRRTEDPFATQTWWYGHLGQAQTVEALTASKRGRFVAPDWWHVDRGAYPLFVLQGWASPLPNPKTYTLSLRVRYDELGGDRTRWAGVYFSAMRDSAYSDADCSLNGGYSAILRTDGRLGLYRKDPGRTVPLKTIRTPPLKKGQVASLRVSVNGSTVAVTRGDGPKKTVSARDATYRGGYVFLGRQAYAGHEGPGVSFADVRVG
jgi:glycerophosphoryl diester phosphodiesterase